MSIKQNDIYYECLVEVKEEHMATLQKELAIRDQNEGWELPIDEDNLERIDKLVDSINKLTKEIKSYGTQS